jgi:hypothetical protein
MGAPILMVVDDDQAMAEALGGDLGRRFGVDYRILTESSAARALAVLERLAAESQRVALVFAGQRLTGTSGVEFLAAAHGLHPAAKRVLRLERGDYTAANPAVRAMTLGQIDYHLLTPWLPAERWLYPPVSDFLADWSHTQPPSAPSGTPSMAVTRSPSRRPLSGVASTSTPPAVQAQVRGGIWVPSPGVTSRTTTNATPAARMAATNQPIGWRHGPRSTRLARCTPHSNVGRPPV